jgi:hypothetical protein
MAKTNAANWKLRFAASVFSKMSISERANPKPQFLVLLSAQISQPEASTPLQAQGCKS